MTVHNGTERGRTGPDGKGQYGIELARKGRNGIGRSGLSAKIRDGTIWKEPVGDGTRRDGMERDGARRAGRYSCTRGRKVEMRDTKGQDSM